MGALHMLPCLDRHIWAEAGDGHGHVDAARCVPIRVLELLHGRRSCITASLQAAVEQAHVSIILHGGNRTARLMIAAGVSCPASHVIEGKLAVPEEGTGGSDSMLICMLEARLLGLACRQNTGS